MALAVILVVLLVGLEKQDSYYIAVLGEHNPLRGVRIMDTPNVIHLTLEFRGGAELLFDNVKKHEVDLPVNHEPWSLKRLLVWIKDNLLKERPELFVQGDIVRPGILVLVNDSDWELLGQLTYEVKDGDNVLFISTLHGG